MQWQSHKSTAHKDTKSFRLQSWLIGTLALLLKISNIRKCSYVLIRSSLMNPSPTWIRPCISKRFDLNFWRVQQSKSCTVPQYIVEERENILLHYGTMLQPFTGSGDLCSEVQWFHYFVYHAIHDTQL